MIPDLKRIKKVLILQYLPFGDVLLGTSYAETLKKTFNPEIHYLTAKPFNQIVEGHPFIDKIICFEKGKGKDYYLNRIKLFRRIRKEKYDLIIDQLGSPANKQMILFSGARYKLGWADSRFSFILNLKTTREYQGYSSTYHFEILKPLGIFPGRYRMYINVPKEAKEKVLNWLQSKDLANPRKFIAVAPSSKDQKKKWNIDRFKELTERLLTTLNKNVVLLYAPNELEDTLKVYNAIKHPNLHLAPELTIKEAAAFLEQAMMLISNDAAIHHMSVATGTPSIAIFGPSNADRWSAEGDFPFHYHLKNPNWERNPDNDFGITVDDVMEKVELLLGELKTTELTEERFYCISPIIKE